MTRLIQEAQIDDRFNAELKKIQSAISNLADIIVGLNKDRAVASQKTQLRLAAQDLQTLHDQLK